MINEKILKSEQLSDVELENVAGGTLNEMVKDTKFLHALGLLDRAYSAKEIKANEEKISGLISDAFGGKDMWASSKIDGMNTYGVDGVNIALTREQAYKELADRVKPGFDYRKYL